MIQPVTTEDLGFVAMITNPGVNVTYLAVTVIVAFGILCFNLQGGLERITKYMMTLLMVLMVVLAVHSATLSGAAEGLKFYLVPDFSKITGTVIVGAMNQAFFTLSVGMGSMAIFGSYIGKEQSLLGESANVIVLDTFVAIVAGLIMFPACYTYGLEVNAGPSLLFGTMARMFSQTARTVDMAAKTMNRKNSVPHQRPPAMWLKTVAMVSNSRLGPALTSSP